jgi:hypothetical protein
MANQRSACFYTRAESRRRDGPHSGGMALVLLVSMALVGCQTPGTGVGGRVGTATTIGVWVARRPAGSGRRPGRRRDPGIAAGTILGGLVGAGTGCHARPAEPQLRPRPGQDPRDGAVGYAATWVNPTTATRAPWYPAGPTRRRPGCTVASTGRRSSSGGQPSRATAPPPPAGWRLARDQLRGPLMPQARPISRQRDDHSCPDPAAPGARASVPVTPNMFDVTDQDHDGKMPRGVQGADARFLLDRNRTASSTRASCPRPARRRSGRPTRTGMAARSTSTSRRG